MFSQLITLKWRCFIMKLQPGSPALAQRSQPISATSYGDSPIDCSPGPDELSPDFYAVSRWVAGHPLGITFSVGFTILSNLHLFLAGTWRVVVATKDTRSPPVRKTVTAFNRPANLAQDAQACQLSLNGHQVYSRRSSFPNRSFFLLCVSLLHKLQAKSHLVWDCISFYFKRRWQF